MKLYFSNGQDDLYLIACPETELEAVKEINRFLATHEYINYYIRSWVNPKTDRTVYDIGSYTDFFELEE